MTKRKSSDEQLWLLVGDDGTLQTVKKDRHEDEEEEEEEEAVQFVERQGDDDDDEDEDDDDDDDDEDDVDNIGIIDLNAEEQESVHNEVYIDQSQVLEEQEHDEINEESAQVSGNGPNDSRLESIPNNVAEEETETTTAAVKWTDKATFQLLDLIEKILAKETEIPSKNDRVWLRIALDMKPFHYTADDCHKKFKYLNRTYRSVLERKANNIPCNWRYFNRMCVVAGNKIPRKRGNPSGLKHINISMPVEPKVEPSTSADFQSMDDDDETNETDMSRFDQLLKKKKEMLLEVKHQGEILQRHVEECVSSTFRREERENDIVKLLMDLKNQEQKKLDLFRKLLDKLWYELWYIFID